MADSPGNAANIAVSIGSGGKKCSGGHDLAGR